MKESSLKKLIYNSAIGKNPVFAAGFVIAPVVVYANTFSRALTLVITFSFLTLFTLLFASFVPRKIVYTVRITLYTIIGAVVYVPVAIILNALIPEQIDSMGIYFPLLITNSFIVSRSETTFFAESKGNMFLDILFSIIGYDAAVLIFGLIREIISTGEFNGQVMAMPLRLQSLSDVYGGFIMLGIFAALFRGILYFIKRFRS